MNYRKGEDRVLVENGEESELRGSRRVDCVGKG